MPAPLSIVIPTLNAAQLLPDTAACLIEGLSCGLVRELVISDGESTDATTTIANDLGAKLVSGARGRGAQLRRGADAANGVWTLFLHADSQLSPGWSDVVTRFVRNADQMQSAGYFRLRYRARGFRPGFFAAGANLRSRLGLPYGDQGLLISRVLYDQIGGYPVIPIMEDVAIVRNLRGKLVPLGATASTDASRYQNGWYRRGLRNMWTLLRYQMGTSPEILAEYYNR